MKLPVKDFGRPRATPASFPVFINCTILLLFNSWEQGNLCFVYKLHVYRVWELYLGKSEVKSALSASFYFINCSQSELQIFQGERERAVRGGCPFVSSLMPLASCLEPHTSSLMPRHVFTFHEKESGYKAIPLPHNEALELTNRNKT